MVPPPSGPLERRAWVAAVMARVAAVAAAKGWELLLLFSDEYFKFVFFVCLWILFVFFFLFDYKQNVFKQRAMYSLVSITIE